jgi:hypothetical protein
VLGPAGYERLAWHSLRAIHLVLFAARRFRRQVLGIHGSTVATGIGNVVGNKVCQTATQQHSLEYSPQYLRWHMSRS